jgi:hypothetical protein
MNPPPRAKFGEGLEIFSALIKLPFYGFLADVLAVV